MANPRGHEASLVKFKPKWRHGQTTVIRVPVALAEQILKYAHSLDEGTVVPNRRLLEEEAQRLCKRKEIPSSWSQFIDFVLELWDEEMRGD